ncbi:MAG: FkbM family methyltransferase [Bacteroidetes bacterium]|nr:FkbM family methyltransferase [Bacteroidota bacterium]
MKLYQNKKLRKIIIPLLKKLNLGNIHIKHHYTGSKFKIDAFIHKGYWYHGKNREKTQMDIFKTIIKEGDTVIELGAHIGYISLYYSKLAGPNGKLFVFEPGANNLPYTRFNLGHSKIKNIELIEKAVSDENGTATFYLENITGQSNSLVKDYRVTKKIQSKTFTELQKNAVEVETIRLDDFVQQRNIKKVDFIKIDIEGAEYLAIKGMQHILDEMKPTMMIEVTENHEALFNMLKQKGYVIIDEFSKIVNDLPSFYGNLFCVYKTNQGLVDKLLQHKN